MILPVTGLVALILSVVLSLLAFATMLPRRALIGTYVWSWLLLPTYGVDFVGIPPMDKTTLPNFVSLLGIALFDSRAFSRFRLKWFDLPMVVWCLVPLASNYSNGDPYWSGVSAVSDQLVLYGIPYYLGRLYFNSYEAMRDLCFAIVIGGLVYVPLCLFEIRMSPQLHRYIYGTQSGSFVHSRRFGGWRPIVFMFGGLQLGLWMVSAAVLGFVLWRERIIRFFMGWPMEWLVGVLAVTTVLVKSTGALLLGIFVSIAYVVIRGNFIGRVALLGMVAMVVTFLTLRIAFDWQGEQVVSTLSVLSEERANSVAFRFENEKKLQDKAWTAPWLGLTANKEPRNAGRARFRVVNLKEGPNYGKDEAITDSLWIIAFGMYGLVGVAALYTAMLLPIVMLAWKVPPHLWRTQELSLVLMAALVVWMSTVDKLLNAMPTPVHGLLGGGLLGFAASFAVARSPQRRPAAGKPATPPGRAPIPKVNPRGPAVDV